MSIATLTQPNGPYHLINGELNSTGLVQFMIPSTTTLKQIWLDEALSAPANNPAPLDISGRFRDQIFLDVGDYDVREWAVLDDAIVAPVWPADYYTVGSVYSINGLANTAVASATLPIVETMAALRALQPTVATSVVLTGYYAAGDKPAKVMTFDPAAGGDNGGTIIVPNSYSIGAWLMPTDTVVDVRDFGAIPNSTSTVNTAIGLALSYANSVGLAVFFPIGIYKILGGGSFSPGKIILPVGAFFNVVSGGMFSISPTISFDIGSGSHDSSGVGANYLEIELGLCPQVLATGCDPDWWNHAGRSVADNLAHAFAKSGVSGIGLWKGYTTGSPASPWSVTCRRVVLQTGGYIEFTNSVGEITLSIDQIEQVGFTANNFRDSGNAALTIGTVKASWFTGTGTQDVFVVNSRTIILDTDITMSGDQTIDFLDTDTGTVTHGIYALTFKLKYGTARSWYI